VLGGAAVLLLGAVGVVVALSAAQPAFACAAQWTAPPSGSPAPDGSPGATPRLGYVQPDLGKNHIPVGQSVQYPLCPPASGRHYNAANLGPIKAQVYGPEDQTVPQGWVHNLEHGGLVVLYRCPGPACDDTGQAAFRQFYSSFPPSPVCKLPVGTVGPVITRFDQMAYPLVALLWGQVLPMDTWNPDLVLAFFNQQAERTNPELLCARPTATPGASAASPAPTASPGASATPGASAIPGTSATPGASAASPGPATPEPTASQVTSPTAAPS
jgi:hypothetical protein